MLIANRDLPRDFTTNLILLDGSDDKDYLRRVNLFRRTMSHYLGSFPVQVPDLPAKVYDINPQPVGDPYSDLSHYENVLESRTGGKAHRFPVDDQYFLVLFGHDHEPREIDAGNGVTLHLAYRHTIEHTDPREVNAVKQALREGLSDYLTNVLDLWEYDERGTFYWEDPEDTVDGNLMYSGFQTGVEFGSDYILSIDATKKFVHRHTLYEQIQRQGREEVQDRYRGRYFFFWRPEPQPCFLHSISETETVEDKTMTIDGEETAVLDFVSDRYGDDFAGLINPDEPIARVQYSEDGRTYDVAPSLLRLIPDGMTEDMTQASALSPTTRWETVEDFIRYVDYIQLGNATGDVDKQPIQTGLDIFDFPRLSFGMDTPHVLAVGTPNETPMGRGTVSKGSWRYAINEYLETFGPRIRPREAPRVALFYPEDFEATAMEAYDAVREYIEQYTGFSLARDPGGVAYTQRSRLMEWADDFAEDFSGALAYMSPDADRAFYDVIEAVNGKAVQHLTHENFRRARGASDHSDILYNTAMGLASKMGVRSALLTEGLSADAIIGLSVAGDDKTTAASITVSGNTGNLIYQTETPFGRGRSTVTDRFLAERIIGDSLTAAKESPEVNSLESVILHKNGNIGNEELEGVHDAVEDLQASGVLSEQFSWTAVKIRRNNSYRIYTDDDDRVCEAGAYSKINNSNIAVAPAGSPFHHQGTPRTVLCTVEESTGNNDIVQVGRDVFALSFLSWWAPDSKLGEPITTRIPRKMHDLLSHCSAVRFPPS